MKKEVFLAITIGFGLGLIITLGIWVANRSLKNLPTTTQATPTPEAVIEETTTETTPSNQALTLNITTPEDESLAATNKTTLTGKTVANAAVTITYEDGQTIITAGTDGAFTFEVPLVSGYNVITVTAFNSTGQSATQTLTVTYTTAKI
jgi:predicted phage tail protein